MHKASISHGSQAFVLPMLSMEEASKKEFVFRGHIHCGSYSMFNHRNISHDHEVNVSSVLGY